MIVGIQSGGIGKVDMSQTGGTTDKSKSKDKASGTFEDLMNLAATNPNTTTQTANSATMKNDVDAVKQADTTVSGEKKQSDLNKYTRSDAKTETTRTTGAEKAKRNEAPQEVESDDLKAELLSNKLKKLLNVDDETLQNLLQTAGLTMQDLLDPAVMKNFILQINDATSVDLLIDESLNNLMQQAMQLLDEVLNVVDETVISTEVPVEELLPEESSSAQTEPQETVLDAEKPQTVEAKTETVAQTTPEEDVTRTDGKSVETQTVDTEVQVTVQTEDAGDSDASADMMKQNAEGVISNLNQAMAQACACVKFPSGKASSPIWNISSASSSSNSILPSGRTTVSVRTFSPVSFSIWFSAFSGAVSFSTASVTIEPDSAFTKSRFIRSNTRFIFAASSANTMTSVWSGFTLSLMTTYKIPLALASFANSFKRSPGTVKNFIGRCSFNILVSLVFPLVFFWSFKAAAIKTATCFATFPVIFSEYSIPSRLYRTT